MSTMNLTRSALGSLAAAGAVTLALAPATLAADASNTAALKKAGDTRLTLDKKAGAALKSLGIKLAPVKGSKVAAGAVVFPITSGSVDPKLTDGALINHSGGLRLTKGRTRSRSGTSAFASRAPRRRSPPPSARPARRSSTSTSRRPRPPARR